MASQLTDKEKAAIASQWLGVVLDHVDYTSGACTLMEPVGACLSEDVIKAARTALEIARGD